MFCLARVINVRPKFLVKLLNELQTMKVFGMVLSKHMGCLSYIVLRRAGQYVPNLSSGVVQVCAVTG